MGAIIMKAHVNRQFVKEVEKVFSSRYPYLKMEIVKEGLRWLPAATEDTDAEMWKHQAEEILDTEIGLGDGMTVVELETRLREILGVPVVILRRSGNFWIETSMTRKWTLREQNDHGQELTSVGKL
jgi:hypothetical protein